MLKKCLLIINPIAGHKRICSELVNVIQELNKAGYQTNVFITSETENATHAISQMTDESLVVCAGGDGTLQQVVTGLEQYDKRAVVGYIPCGSTNDYATTLGLNKNIKKAIKAIVNGSISEYDVGEFNTITIDNKIITQHFVYIASFGKFSATSYNTSQETKNNFGHMAYLFNGLYELLDNKSYPVRIRIDNVEEIEDEFILGMVANTLSVGGIVKLDPTDVDLSDGLFEVVFIKQPKTLLEFNEIVDGLVLKNFNSSMFVYRKAHSVSCWFNESVVWSLDGEESAASDYFKIENLNKQLLIQK